MSLNFTNNDNTKKAQVMSTNTKMELSQDTFVTYQKLIFSHVGISLDDTKKTLVQSRLYKRLLYYNLTSYADYLRIVQVNNSEKMEMINLITTNETYFFREEIHFDFLSKTAKHSKGKFRVWSAAASIGAEAYTIAMVLNDILQKDKWEIVASDINTDVIKKARMGLYPEGWLRKIPYKYVKKYCLKGTGKFEKQFLIDRELNKNITFDIDNLMIDNNTFGLFDIIFLRNVLIYFNEDTKKIVIENLIRHLKDGGYLIISLTESLQHLGISALKQTRSSIYKKI